MAFFPRTFYNAANTEASFTPLFRLLDDFDTYSRQGSGHRGRRSHLPTFQPKFDVRETGETYELHGELPGMVKDNVQIEFTEPQTLVVRGRVERSYTAGTSPNAPQPVVEDTVMSGAVTEGTEGSEATEERRNSHQATVEDEDDAKASESGWEDVSETTKKTDEQAQVAEKHTEKPVEKPTKPADKSKYWLTERSIGEFSRSFSFPARVEQDGVSASLNDGILSVTVPKAKKHEARRINIA